MITFEVHLRSTLHACNPVAPDPPFPGCCWNEEENRWEWSTQYVTSLVSLARDLGMGVLIRPLATTAGDLDVLEIVDVEEEEPQMCGQAHQPEREDGA